MSGGDQDRWERIVSLFHGATALPADQRQAFVAAESEGDPALAAEVMGMLAADDGPANVLDRGLARTADRMLESLDPSGQFGRYRLLSVLGECGMEVVYLGERDDLGSRAAIKILRDAWLSPARRERFASEQRTLAQLDHPAIAKLLDADALPDGTPWFVMEYVEGLPLTTYCRKHGSSLRGRLLLFRAVCEAVQHAHQHAVIHRDLKPSNILVRSDGAVKLLDFGIAKHLESLDTPVDQTQTGLRLMTPAYASPEQIRGGKVGIHTDIYSLGVVLYELLAGRLPFDLGGLTPSEVLDAVVLRVVEKPSALATAVAARSGGNPWVTSISKPAWADLDVLCLTAMHRDPDRRYRTVEALIRDVDHFLAGEPLAARPDTLPYRMRKFVGRNRGPVAAAALALMAAIALVTFYTVRLATARNTALAQVARTERIQRFTLNLFQGGEDAVAPADSLRVVALLEQGVREAAALDREPQVQTELYQTLGGIYQQLGKLDRADSLLQLALARRQAQPRPDEADIGRSLVALGQLRIDQAQLDTALQLINSGLARATRALPADHPTVIEAKVALGRVLEERGDYPGAIAVMEEVVRLDAKDPASRDAGLHLSGLANAHFYAGHYPIADSLNKRVLAMNRQRYGDRHPIVAEDLINLGHIQQDLGSYPEAENLFREALGITEAWYGNDHPKTAVNSTVLGRSLLYQNRFDEAVGLLERALAIQERVYGPVHLRVASTLNELGSVAQQRNQFDLAEARFRRVLEIYRAVHGNRHQHVGVALSNLASAIMAKGDFRRAEGLFREALSIFGETVAPDHINVAIGQIKLGRALLRQRRFLEATKETSAGYETLAKQANPAVSFLRAARIDLAAAFDSLGQSDRAARFRAELADTAKRAN